MALITLSFSESIQTLPHPSPRRVLLVSALVVFHHPKVYTLVLSNRLHHCFSLLFLVERSISSTSLPGHLSERLSYPFSYRLSDRPSTWIFYRLLKLPFNRASSQPPLVCQNPLSTTMDIN